MTMLEQKGNKNFLAGKWRAKVMDNADPLQKGRIKAQVYPWLATVDTADLPWAVPDNARVSGGASGTVGSLCVPAVGSMVWVEFEAGSIYQPVYGGEASDGANGIPTELLTHYPNRRGYKTTSGFVFYIDDQSQELRITHPNGSYFVMDNTRQLRMHHTNGSYLHMTNDGDVVTYGIRDVNATALRDANISANRNIGLMALGTISVTALNSLGGTPVPSEINITGDFEMNVEGNVTQTVDGAVTQDVTGNVSQTVSGDCSMDVTGSVDISCSSFNVTA